MVRLFVYQTEANEKQEPEKSILVKQFQLMQRRLWYGITWPSAIITFILGPWLFFVYFPQLIGEAYFVLKLCFVGALALYQLQCHIMFTQLQKNEYKRSAFFYRVWNEVATILLFAIVFLIELKQNTQYVWYTLGIIVLITSLYIGILLYKKNREKKD